VDRVVGGGKFQMFERFERFERVTAIVGVFTNDDCLCDLTPKRLSQKGSLFFMPITKKVVFLLIKISIDLLLIHGKRRSIKTYF